MRFYRAVKNETDIFEKLAPLPADITNHIQYLKDDTPILKLDTVKEEVLKLLNKR